MKLGRTLLPVVSFFVLAVVVAVIPSFVSEFRAQQFAYVGIYLVAIIGLNVLTGYTGQISLGHGAFMAVGGYTTAILMADHGVKDIWTIGLVAGTAGFLFGIPALRLSGLYLALATFAIAVSMPAVIKRFEGFTGGGTGINLFGIPELTASLTPVGNYVVAVCTRGGNQSWNKIAKRFDRNRCDHVFVHVADGRRWFIPSARIEGETSIVVGGRKYAEFEVEPGSPLPPRTLTKGATTIASA